MAMGQGGEMIAAFNFTMNQWRRMCNYYADKYTRCSNDCPILSVYEEGCGAIYENEFAYKVSYAELENLVIEWAKENPEPVYPTWKEVCKELGLVTVSVDSNGYKKTTYNWEKQIPAEIARKLGVKPKEG